MALLRRKQTQRFPVVLGEKYQDQLTGFEGTATGRHEYLYGCVRVTLESGKDGRVEVETFDEQRLVDVVGARPKPTATSGGPRDVPAPREP